jgi:hypothetical protein
MRKLATCSGLGLAAGLLCLWPAFALRPSRPPLTIAFAEGKGRISWVCLVTNDAPHPVVFWPEAVEYKTSTGWVSRALPIGPGGLRVFGPEWVWAGTEAAKPFSMPSWLNDARQPYFLGSRFPGIGTTNIPVTWRVRCRYQKVVEYDFDKLVGGLGWSIRGHAFRPGTKEVVSESFIAAR